jgi:hypothetical protein
MGTGAGASREKGRWPVGVQGDVEDAVMSWLDKDDLANADGSLFDAVIDALGLERTGWSCHPSPDGQRWTRFHDKNSVHMDGCVPTYVLRPPGVYGRTEG